MGAGCSCCCCCAAAGPTLPTDHRNTRRSRESEETHETLATETREPRVLVLAPVLAPVLVPALVPVLVPLPPTVEAVIILLGLSLSAHEDSPPDSTRPNSYVCTCVCVSCCPTNRDDDEATTYYETSSEVSDVEFVWLVVFVLSRLF